MIAVKTSTAESSLNPLDFAERSTCSIFLFFHETGIIKINESGSFQYDKDSMA
jgi:hypothetical protein